ncbi:23S rRNA (pseudouridine(1915)-N(3))-methyltransferase RlmH [Lewinella cohaerens]|uniref:23S rRNA (pseudouridine(1915)-N(3))-methyltransferase RlmH n=1 Tax=Lewinella cohaerens TaxID=70995 RepID=UPI00036A8A4E|nr:23S rRNA (pseudouridine(1915)-N(3))-methyltransferase RlmH [Lewinella cohaerens]
MKVECWFIGKTADRYLREGIDKYAQRLPHYLPFEKVILPDIKNAGKLSSIQLKQKEAELVLSRLKPQDALFILDEKGKQLTSEDLSQWVDQQLQGFHRRLIFLVGGAFGFDDAIYQRANGKLSLSKMTFSHQMVRLFWLEQLYRAMTILKNEPYHNP